MKRRLFLIYKNLYAYFGPQHWWPAKSPFEVMVGVILTQNTSWRNVERAIENLRQKRLLSAQKIYRLSEAELTGLIKPAGYYNIKARRLRAFLDFFFRRYSGDFKKIAAADTQKLRSQLLSVKGIGPETADSMLLYALNKPVFVVDAYTRRILLRHGMIKADTSYTEVQKLYMQNLKNEVKLFNEYHALLVKLGKDFCLKNKPRCKICPLKCAK